MSDEKQYPYSSGSRESTSTGYSVEARSSYHTPEKIGDQIFDNRWRTVYFSKAGIGVPRGSIFRSHELAEFDLFSYQAAQALRWWFHAEIEAARSGGGLCIETRLVKHTIKVKMSSEAVSHHKEIGGNDRSSVMPDYGNKS